MKKSNLFSTLFLLGGIVFAQGMTPESAFHFNHYKLTKDSEISAAFLNTPITDKDRIVVSKDGHLEVNGKRIRIFGTNLSEFPLTHEVAEFEAKALANQGYNCIRFHHTDASWSNCFLTKNSDGKYVINEKRLDDFDYFFAELKKNGVYSNINFLTGREISEIDGFKPGLNKVSDWKARHCLGFWDEDARQFQREYASTLMNHVNPYTGYAYKDDPAVAIVEINNENGLLMSYLTGWLEEYSGYYWKELETKWNEWLKKNNYDYAKLDKLFNKTIPVSKSLIDANSKWNLEQHSGAKAALTSKTSSNGNEVSIKVQKNGAEAWNVQYNCSNLSMKNGQVYTIKFSAKASSKAEIGVSLMQAHAPWKTAGWNINIPVTPQWKEYVYVLENVDTDDNLRLNFGGMGVSEGVTFSFKNVELLEGGQIENVKPGLSSTKSVTTVALPYFQDYKLIPDGYRKMILSFMYELEEDYWKSMQSYVRNSIGTKALIMGTIVGCSTPGLQSCFDIIDTHAYWNHPVFPERDWDRSQFYVNNADLLTSTQMTLFNLAKNRVYGKPFCVSEYDHPHPNQYNSEAYPMLASFASFQDWDCLFTFCSTLPTKADGQNEKIRDYFDQSNNPSKSCAAPIVSRIFREFMVNPAQDKIYLNLSRDTELINITTSKGWDILPLTELGSIIQLSAFNQLGVNYEGITKPEMIKNGKDVLTYNRKDYENSVKGFDPSKQLYWDTESGIFLVFNDKVAVTCAEKNAVMPQFPAEWENYGKECIKPVTGNKDFVSFVAVQNSKIEKKSYVVFSCKWTGNSNENLREYKTAGDRKLKIIRDPVKLTINHDLGTGPALALCGDFILRTESNQSLYTVNLNGNRTAHIKAEKGLFEVDSRYKTLWFIVE